MAVVEQVAGRASAAPAPFWTVTRLRIAALVAIFALWEIASGSGFFYSGVIPSSLLIVKAFVSLLLSASFWFHAGVTGVGYRSRFTHATPR